MRDIEEAAFAEGISQTLMFERVALATAQHIHQRVAHLSDARITFLVGGGNNGTDGLVSAVHLHSIAPTLNIGVYIVKARSEDDPYLQAAKDAELFIVEAAKDQQYRLLRNMVASADVVVDAVLGIGTRLPLEGEITKIFRNIHQALTMQAEYPPEGIVIQTAQLPDSPMLKKPFVLALDCPSGINADSGEVDKLALQADETLTFIAVKQGMLIAPAAEHVGNLSVATLGIPPTLGALQSQPIQLATQPHIQQRIPSRADLSHKGSVGKVFIVGGSVNYVGAVGLSAKAAYRAGAGRVTVAAPMPVLSALASQLLEPTWVMLPQSMGIITENAADVLQTELEGYDALLIGPGLGQEEETAEMLMRFLATAHQPSKHAKERRSLGFGIPQTAPKPDDSENTFKIPPLVLDADALNLLAKRENWHETLPAQTILTPHPGEMARLCGISTQEVQAQRMALAIEKAAAWQAIVVLKGAHTVVTAPDGQAVVLPFKTSALATAGTGDVLAGVIVGLLGQGLSPFDAAVVGAYVHGGAGMLALAFAGSPHGVIASDVLEVIGNVIGELI